MTHFTYGPDAALIVVDMQHDFADPSGSLYVPGGQLLTVPINLQIADALAAGALVAYTQDWHPATTPHFVTGGGPWPVHCVAETLGARLVPELDINGPIIYKGQGSDDGYSGFTCVDMHTGKTRPTDLATILDEAGVMRVLVVGLAGDWCVKATAIDAVRLGYLVTVSLALTAFVELHPGDAEAAIRQMRSAGVLVCDDLG